MKRHIRLSTALACTLQYVAQAEEEKNCTFENYPARVLVECAENNQRNFWECPGTVTPDGGP